MAYITKDLFEKLKQERNSMANTTVSSLIELKPLTGPRFVNVGHVIINQHNVKQKDPTVIKDVGHLVGLRESHEPRDPRTENSRTDHIYVIDYYNKNTQKVDKFKFDYNSYQKNDIELFCQLVEEYLDKNKRLELYHIYSAQNPIATSEALWLKVEDTMGLLKEKNLDKF